MLKINTNQENYLKAIYSISTKNSTEYVNTNAIADKLSMKAASVTEMLKKLDAKKLVDYKKYNGVKLTKRGEKQALQVIRKHRLWEVFLLEKLEFKWDEVHDIAEQLEHIKSTELTKRLDKFLDFPQFDPHGDPIPTEEGIINDNRKTNVLAELAVREEGIMTGVVDSSSSFLQYLERTNLTLGKRIKVLDKIEFDSSLDLEVNKKKISISHQAAKNIIVKPTHHG